MKPHDNNERAAVAAARRGDTEALAGLYEYYCATLVWVACSALLDRPLAEFEQSGSPSTHSCRSC